MLERPLDRVSFQPPAIAPQPFERPSVADFFDPPTAPPPQKIPFRMIIAAKAYHWYTDKDENGNPKVEAKSGGEYQISGLHSLHHKDETAHLKELIESGQGEQARDAAVDYLAAIADTANLWSRYAPINAFLRDCILCHGEEDALKILQRAAGVEVDGKWGPTTEEAIEPWHFNRDTLSVAVDQLRRAREAHFRDLGNYGDDEPLESAKGWELAREFAQGMLKIVNPNP